MRNWNHALGLIMADPSPERMIKQLLNSVITNFFVTDKSRYFAQPRPIIINFSQETKILRLWE